MTLAGLPRAGAISKPHVYKENLHKMKDLLKKMSFNPETVWKFPTKKNQKIQSSYGEQNEITTKPRGQKLNMNHVARKNLIGAKLKKASTIKLLEICKTRTKKSSPDLFNFCVISADHDMAKDAGRATTCRRIFKAPILQTERTKSEGPTEKMSFTGEQFENFKPKKLKNPVFARRTKQKNHKTPKAKTKHEPGSHEGIKWSKNEKKQSEKNCSNSARLELRIKSWPVQFLCDLGWSWHGQ